MNKVLLSDCMKLYCGVPLTASTAHTISVGQPICFTPVSWQERTWSLSVVSADGHAHLVCLATEIPWGKEKV